MKRRNFLQGAAALAGLAAGAKRSPRPVEPIIAPAPVKLPPTITWSNAACSTPLADLRAMIERHKGYSNTYTFGSQATIVLSPNDYEFAQHHCLIASGALRVVPYDEANA